MAESKTKYEYGRTPEETAPGLIGFLTCSGVPLLMRLLRNAAKSLRHPQQPTPMLMGRIFPAQHPVYMDLWNVALNTCPWFKEQNRPTTSLKT